MNRGGGEIGEVEPWYISLPTYVYQRLYYAFDNRNVPVFGARETGKSTFLRMMELNSQSFRKPRKTTEPGKIRKHKIDYLSSCKPFSVKVQDNGGERIYWHDTLRRIVDSKPKNMIFMLRAFNLRDDGLEVKRDEHLVQVPSLMESFAIRQVKLSERLTKDYWVCEEDVAAFEFITTLFYDFPAFHAIYGDVLARCSDIGEKLYNRRNKIRPKLLYMCVNFADILPENEIEKEMIRILKPYQKMMNIYGEHGCRVRKIAFSALEGTKINEFLEEMAKDNKWFR